MRGGMNIYQNKKPNSYIKFTFKGLIFEPDPAYSFGLSYFAHFSFGSSNSAIS